MVIAMQFVTCLCHSAGLYCKEMIFSNENVPFKDLGHTYSDIYSFTKISTREVCIATRIF